MYLCQVKKFVNSLVQEISDAMLQKKRLRVFVMREDLLHKTISGNKWRKLKYNIAYAKTKSYNTLVTFGGAYSNHIAATAAAGKEFGFSTFGFIRGESYQPLNPTLDFASSCGMELRYVSRVDYKNKNTPEFQGEYFKELKNFYVIPEGGTNSLAVKGCSEILTDCTIDFDIVCCACGTGGTLSGLIHSLKPHQHAMGFPVLKGTSFLNNYIDSQVLQSNWSLIEDYHFGGYAKVDSALVDFVNNFKRKHRIALDPIYTGKMMFGLWDLIDKDYFRENTKIIAIHTGGIQGIKGMNERLKNKDLQFL